MEEVEEKAGEERGRVRRIDGRREGGMLRMLRKVVGRRRGGGGQEVLVVTCASSVNTKSSFLVMKIINKDSFITPCI